MATLEVCVHPQYYLELVAGTKLSSVIRGWLQRWAEVVSSYPELVAGLLPGHPGSAAGTELSKVGGGVPSRSGSAAGPEFSPRPPRVDCGNGGVEGWLWGSESLRVGCRDRVALSHPGLAAGTELAWAA
jgi:hypothetical protein